MLLNSFLTDPHNIYIGLYGSNKSYMYVKVKGKAKGSSLDIAPLTILDSGALPYNLGNGS